MLLRRSVTTASKYRRLVCPATTALLCLSAVPASSSSRLHHLLHSPTCPSPAPPLQRAIMTSQSRSATTLTTTPSTPLMDPLPLNANLPASVLPPGFTKVPAQNGSPAYTVFERAMETSANDKRSYRVIRLENGLEALLIHDAKTDKAAASLSVNVGHLSDPPDLQGLAHFCEHLLFMGTEKYPRENEYSEFLSKNAGSSNAFTDMDDTNYFFDIHPSKLDDILDRFAQFFISPLFDPSCTEREIRAVDSEHKKNLQSDTWRLYQLDKSTSSHDHVYWRFGTGSLETLWDAPKRQGKDVRSELLEFHKRHYSANVMKLVVLGTESLDDLVKMVVSKFTAVPNKDVQPPIFSGSPYTENELHQLMYAKTVKDSRRLEMSFPFPDQGPLYDCKPGHVLTHYVGHEGPGSILSVLKKKGWASELSAGVGGGATGFDFFRITIEMTKEGLERHKDVIKTVYAYLELLRNSPPQEWAFKEIAMLSEIDFKFKEDSQPSTYVMTLSGQMQRPFPRDKLLSAPLVVRKFDPELIQRTIAGLKPGECRLSVGNQDGIEGVNYDLKEQWYGTEYTITTSDPNLHQNLEFDGLALPKPNSFIPSNLNVDKQDVVDFTKRPNWIKETPITTLWHKKDDRWWLPRGALFVKLRNPVIDSTVENAVKSQLFAKLVSDALSEYAYDAELAGLSYTLESSDDNILLTMEGYNDKLPVLGQVILEKMRDLKVDVQRFEVIKDQLVRRYKNFSLDPPYKHANYWTTAVTIEKFWTFNEKLEALNAITAEEVVEFMKLLFKRLNIEVLVYGNLHEEEALKMADLVESTFKPEPLTHEEKRSRRALLIPESSNSVIIKPVPNPSNVNTGVEYFCYVGDVNDQVLRCKVSLLAQLIDEPCFNQLRTKEQLGYIVASGSRQTIGSCGIRIIIQSERDGIYLEDRINTFLKDTVSELLNNMSEEDFENEKESLVNKKLEDFKNGWEEANFYWTQVRSGYYSFLKHIQDAEFIKTFTKKDVIEFYETFIHPDSFKRAKLSFHLQSQYTPIPSEVLTLIRESLKVQFSISLDEETMKKLVESKPDVKTLKESVQVFLKEQKMQSEQVEQVLIKLESLSRDLMKDHDDKFNKSSPSDEILLGQNVKVYRDWVEYKSLLKPGPYAVPDEDYKGL